MKITFQTDVSFKIGDIVNSEGVKDLRDQGVVGDVQVTSLLPGLRKSNPDIAKGKYRYRAQPYPQDFDPPVD